MPSLELFERQEQKYKDSVIEKNAKNVIIKRQQAKAIGEEPWGKTPINFLV
ncbi:MAG: hypothetical protein MRQ09_01320 [Candidatus Midichloria sp.]|nr:hypothetical protein [Candidatus Midichloria sp.]